MTTYAMDSPSISDMHVKTDVVCPVALIALFVLVYMQGYIEQIGVPRNTVKIISEVPVFLILILLVNRGIGQFAPGFFFIVGYVVWTVLSTLYYGDSLVMAFLYCRYVVYGYIVFVVVWNTPLTAVAVKRINATLALVFVFQIVASAYEVFLRGERIEAHVGSLCADGGSLATEFPLLAMALTVSLYLYYRGNPLLLVLSWAFFLVGYASGKRAIYFLGPFLYFSILAWYMIRVRTWHALKRSLGGLLIFVGLVPLVLFGISRSAGIGQSRSRHVSEQVRHAFNAAREYTTREGRAGETEGRAATNQRVFSTLFDAERETIVLGRGPSAMRAGQGRFDSLMITYGICGWARDVICIGWPGMLIYVLFHVRLFCCLRAVGVPRHGGYWQAVHFAVESGCLVILISYVAYSCSVPTSGHLSYVYLYLLALVTSPQHQHLTLQWRQDAGRSGTERIPLYQGMGQTRSDDEGVARRY